MAFSTPQVTDYEWNNSASFSRRTALTSSSHSALFEDHTYSFSAALVNRRHKPRKSSISNTVFPDNNRSSMGFQPQDIWKNALKFHHSSLDDLLDISTAASSTLATTIRDEASVTNTYGPPKIEQPMTVARILSKPGAPSSSRTTHSSTDNEKVTRRGKNCNYCKFCQTNNEIAEVYLSHTLYEPNSRTLMCPVLRRLVCPTCGATGDQAHTISYCPVRKANAFGEQKPLFTKIKKSCRLASGKIRI